MSHEAKKGAKLRGGALENFKREPFTFPSVSTPSTSSVQPTPSPPSLISSSTTAPSLLLTTAPSLPTTTSLSLPPTTAPSLPPTTAPSLPPTTAPSLPPTTTHCHRPSTSRPKVSTPTKKINQTESELLKKQKTAAMLDKKLARLKNELKDQEQRLSMYSKKNVKRREDRYTATKLALRKEKNKLSGLARKQADDLVKLRKELLEVKRNNAKLEKKSAHQRTKIVELLDEKKQVSNRLRYYMKRHGVKRDGKEPAMEDDTDEGERVVETKGLPSRAACQRIADEGQVLAKSYINSKVLRRCKGFGVHKDGTTRRKVKILDTSVNTDEGEAYCLGWSPVVSETGQAIADDTRDKLEEVVKDLDDAEDGMKEVLLKLEYYMNDRAANEKKSSVLIDKWRDETLRNCGEQASKVHHLHCAANALLGFHTNVMNALKKLDFIPNQEHKHPVPVMLWDAAALFGPIGDYRGLRNQWEALGLQKGEKSCIKSYKDNPFNGLFEVAAQVFHHHLDFVQLLESQPSNNTKQTKLYNSLTNPVFVLVLEVECLGLYFHTVTGPFWKIVISPKTSHQQFKKLITLLKDDLQKCRNNPHHFFKTESFRYFRDFTPTSPETKQKLSTSLVGEKMREITSAISDGLLTTIEMQLKDVLEREDASEIKAPLTNLISERNVGHLDASQRRRPHCSLHHHSSVMLLKQTRKRLRTWYDGLENDEKKRLWKSHEKSSIVQHDCEKDTQDVTVSFGGRGKTLGVFTLPSGRDVHTVSRRSVVEAKLDFEPRASGRLWLIKNANSIQIKFKNFK
ncbi:hypothetical protein RRG08_061286 [Elysia crispata]|uniref:Uncharacterized protein n=1 Tax=Elysia crispata TaxID=231223 RepID=A0AAE0YEX1_9GAST|nr:hypothetical protein RRG08_061286 [Elysia crispata]